MIRSTIFCIGKGLFCSLVSILVFSFISFSQNAIVTENALAGNPYSEWGVPDFRDNRISGFATKMSLNRGSTVRFKINVQTGATYTLRIYRIGYYGGNGARLKANLGTLTGTVQPSGISNSSTGHLDCSNWSESATWAIPSSAVSGLYIAKLERTGGGSNHIVFIVRNDASNSDLYVQMPDATWQAYNGYGGTSMYDGTTGWPSGHAVKVSYNRPFFPYNSLFNTDGREADWYMNSEYPMIRWLERNGYDATYTSCNDVDNNGSRLLNHQVFVTVGHDEYWSKQQRENVEAARNAGVHIAFFSGNEVYWKTRWESSDGSEDRTLVCYKEGFMGDGTLGERSCGSKCDPSSEWTGLWRTGENYDAGQPENSLGGQISWVENPAEIGVPAFYKNLRFWRNTSVANLTSGQTAFLGVNTLGYEWDYEQPVYASSYPAGRITMSSRTLNALTHKLSLYRHSSGALVFGAGTVQWSWGLDGEHWGGSTTISPEMQQATVNLFADMGVQPGTLQAGLTSASQSTDITAPTATITSPANGATFSSGATITFSGNANDGGGGVVASVEISVDGGSSWTPATATSIASSTSWTYTWSGESDGTYNVRIRGIDDSGNKGNPGSGITVTVGGAGDLTPPTVSSVSPANAATGVSVNTTVIANFSEAISSSSVTGSTYQLRDAGNNLVSASVSTSGSQITLTPTAALSASTTYTATITGGSSGVKDLSGNALVSNYSWTFTTGAGGGGGGSVTLFLPSSVPAEPLANDEQGIALGMRFRTTQNGFITGIRYYKGAGTTGTHTGHLWSNTGTQLAQATFTNETSSGWQQVLFSSPVAVTAGVTYVASYFSPSGDYCATKTFFTQAVVNGPLRGLADGEDGPNGLYRYTAASAFPNSSFQSSNYWVDVVFTSSGGGTLPAITLHPSSQTVCAGTNVSFTSAANGSPAPSVQWQESTNGTSWTNISGATNSTLSVSATTALNNRQYRAVWTNSGGSVNSNSATLTVKVIPAAPTVSVVNNCGSSTLTASSFTGSLLWSTGATSTSITVTTAGTYTVTQTVNGCTSPTGSGTAAPINSNVPAPTVSVVNNCGSSTLTAGSFTGSLLWSTGATSTSITVTAAGTYTVTQTVNGCASPARSGIAAPKPIPALSSSLTGTATSGVTFTYVPSSNVSGTTFSWTRAAVTGISNATASGTGNITETLNNATSSPVNVTYVYTLTANGCTNTKNVVVTVNPVMSPPINCTINNTSLTSNFSGTAIPAGRYIWFNSSLDPGSLGTGTDAVTMNITNGVISFTANNVQYNLSVPNARIRFDASVTSASTQFINNVWETVVPRNYTSDVFMGGLSYLVPVNFPGNFMNVNWTTNISIDKSGISVGWRWAAAVYTSFADHPGLNVKPINGSTQNPYANLDRASTPENFKSFVVDGAKGTGGTNYTGNFSLVSTATCTDNPDPEPPTAPTVTVVNNCGNSVLTAGSFTGSLLWSNGATTSSITVTQGGTYTVTQTVNGLTSAPGSGTAAPINSNVPAPSVTVVNNCGSSTLTAGSFTGSLLWNTGATTASITVTAAGTYTVRQTVNGCISPTGSGVAAPKAIPALSSSLAATATSSSAFNYTATSSTSGTTFGWSRAAVTGISNGAATGNGNISETLVNTTISPVNVTYVYTLTANGCTNTQNVMVTVGADGSIVSPAVTTQPASQAGCIGLNASFISAASGSPAPTVQWQVSTNGTTWTNITGATNATLSFATATADNNKQYRAVWTNSGGTVNSNAAILTVNSTPVAPGVITVVNDCGSSLLTASGYTGALLWSNGATTASITVSTAGTYVVTQTVNGCTSPARTGIASPKAIPPALNVAVANNCGNSLLSVSGYIGTLLWSNGAATSAISVNTAGTFTVAQTVNGCTSTPGSGTAAPKAIPSAPNVAVANNCGSSVLTATGVPGATFSWSTGATTESITVTINGSYTVRQTANNCISPFASAIAATKAIPTAPNVTVANNCGHSVLTATGAAGATFLWSTGAATSYTTVTTDGTYTVTQTVNGCTSLPRSSVAAPKPIPALTSSLTATATSSSAFNYTATSSTAGTTFAWSRATVAGISNGAATGNGNIGETLVNTTASPVNVTYVYTLTANGCTNTQNVVVTVGVDGSIVSPAVTTQPASQTKCAGLNVSFSSAASGSPVPTVQWQESTNGTNWNNISGATTSILSFTTTAADNNKQYRAVWSNMAGTATSNTATLTVNPIPAAPSVSVVDNCDNSVLTATGAPGATFSWSNGATTEAITVTTNGTYTLNQTVNNCTSAEGSGVAAPKPIPALSSSLTATVTSSSAFNYTATSSTAGTTFAWSRATVTGISNGAATGNGNISETLVNTTISPVNVTYVYTLTANGCTNTQNVVVTVDADGSIVSPAVTTQPASQIRCVGLNASFSSAASGSPAPTVQWQVSTNGTTWTNITGATNATLSFATATADNNKQYRAVWTNSGGTVNSNAAILTVNSTTPVAPGVITVVNDCGSSLLTASGYTGALLWSNGATTASITVSTAGTYAVTQTVNGCTSPARTGIASPKAIPPALNVAVANNCGNSLLSVSGYIGTLLWSNGAATSAISVNTAGTFTVAQTVNGCTSIPGSGTAAPKAIPSAPNVAVANNCGSSVLTATGVPGATFSWSTGATTESITVTINGSYTVRQTANNCISPFASAIAATKAIPSAPNVTVANNCGHSVLTATGAAGATFLWSTGAATSSITVTTDGTYTVTQTVNGCASLPRSSVAAPKPIPALTSSLTATATSSSAFNYTAASSTGGTTFAWSRATVAGISNGAATGNGNIGETLVNTTASPVNVTYIYTLTANGCTNTQNVVVTVGVDGSIVSPAVTTQPASQTKCAGLNVSFSSAASGSPVPTVQWQESTNGTNWNNISGATTSILSFTTTAADNNKQYRAVWSNMAGTATSNTATLTVNPIPAAPSVSVVDNCDNSVLTATGAPGATFSWSNGATTEAITVTTNGTYTLNQTVNNCTSAEGSGVAAPKPIPTLSSNLTATATSSSAFNYTATSSTAGTTFAWSRATVTGISNGAATGNGNISETLVNTTVSPVIVTYVYTLTANGCTNTQNVVVTVGVDGSIVSPAVTIQPASQTKCAGLNVSFSSAASGSPAPTVQWQESTNGTIWNNISGATTSILSFTTTAADNNKQYRAVSTNIAGTATSNTATLTVNPIPAAPGVSVTNNCGSSLLTVTGAPGATFLWSNGATTEAITVTTSTTYTVNQTVNNCTSAEGSGVAAPKPIPTLSSNLTATATSSSAFNYTATSSTAGTTFAWSRATVTGISNGAATGNGNISETLVNTTISPVIVTYVYTLTADGCTNTQNLVVTVGVDGNIVSPAVTTQPSSQTKCSGLNVSFSSAASGSPVPTVQWQESTNGTNWNNITGATTGTLTFTTTAADNNKQYRAVWANIAGAANSNAALLTVNPIPAAPGVSVTNNCGSSLLTATGAPGATFLWSNGASTESITVTTSTIYTVNQTVNNCTSSEGSGVAAPKPIPALTSSLTATATSSSAFNYTATSSTSGTTFAWSRATVEGISNGAATGNGNISETLVNTTVSTVNVTYVYTLTADGCTNTQNVVVTVDADGSIVSPAVTTQPASQTKCVGLNVNFSSAASGSPAPTVQWQESKNGVSWHNLSGATNSTLSFTTTAQDNNNQYRAVWTNIAGSATSNAATLTVNTIPGAPGVSVTNNCGNSVLTATGVPEATFLWSNGAASNSITVPAGTYTVTQTVNDCTSPPLSSVTAPKIIPVLSSNLSATATSGTVFTYTAASTAAGTTFAWSRAAVTGISNAAATGNGNISETLVNTTASPVDVAYVYTLTADGCTNTQNVVVTVNPVTTVNCIINGSSMVADFNSTSIPAGRYIWFNSSFDPGSLGTGTTPVTMSITNTVISFTANSQQYVLNVPDARIRFDDLALTASTQFVNGIWETVVPHSFTSYIFMTGLSYQVPVDFPGSISNVRWTTNVTIDQLNTSVDWRWSAAVYTIFAGHSSINVKPISGNILNPYPNSDEAGTPENFKTSLVSGARGIGEPDYTGNYVNSGSITCSTILTRPAGEPLITKQTIADRLHDLVTDKFPEARDLVAQVMPNPSSTFFNLAVRGSNEGPVTIKIMDIFGRIVERHDRIAANTVLKVGDKWTNGSYFVEVVQGSQRKIIQIIKAR